MPDTTPKTKPAADHAPAIAPPSNAPLRLLPSIAPAVAPPLNAALLNAAIAPPLCESGLPLLQAASYALGKSAIKLERNAAAPQLRAAIEKELEAIEKAAARIRRRLIAAL